MVEYNSAEYFERALLAPTGFREYDARWIVEPIDGASSVGLNYVGARQVGYRLGQFLVEHLDAGRSIVVGHDFRKYSEHVKNAVVVGLLQSGMDVVDIGLTTTPGAYFAQFALDIACVAVVTASHNENGWTGLKVGHRLASTFGPDEMAAFRDLVLKDPLDANRAAAAGSYVFDPSIRERYVDDLVETWSTRFEGAPRLRVAVETGNGTAGLYLPTILDRLGFDVVRGNVGLDWNFPNFNPNPESITFLRAVEGLVSSSGSDLGLCVDGDGDRLGLVDDKGRLAFSDKVGLLIAKELDVEFGVERPIVIDVKSTSLFETELRAPLVWAKTGHSYVKAKVAETNAIAGFERSGHFFFGKPLGRGYDDACVAALAVLWTLCRARNARPSVSMSDLLGELPRSFSSPNRQPAVSDETKYDVVDQIATGLSSMTSLAGKQIIDVNYLNGVRVTLEDRSWLLVRASSNSPNLVIIAEAFDEDGSLLRAMDEELRLLIRQLGVDLGNFDPLHEV